MLGNTQKTRETEAAVSVSQEVLQEVLVFAAVS
jgi:hypothetical protein